jgi:hypothetical protein
LSLLHARRTRPQKSTRQSVLEFDLSTCLVSVAVAGRGTKSFSITGNLLAVRQMLLTSGNDNEVHCCGPQSAVSSSWPQERERQIEGGEGVPKGKRD